MPDSSFIQKLRMAKIFGGSPPLGMPDFDAGGGGGGYVDPQATRQQQQMDEENMLRLKANVAAGHFMTPSGQLQSTLDRGREQLATQQKPQQTTPNVLYKPDITPYQQGQLGLGRAKLAQTGEIARMRQEGQEEERGIRQQRANVYERMHDLTDAERQDIITERMMKLGESREEAARNLQELRGEQSMGQINRRGEIQGQLQEVRGAQNLASIGRRIQGQKDIAGIRSGRPEQPTQTTARYKNQAVEFAARNPNLGKWIELDEDGIPVITPPAQAGSGYFGFGGTEGPTAEEYKKITDAVFGTAPPAKTTPAAPAKSKYTVTVK